MCSVTPRFLNEQFPPCNILGTIVPHSIGQDPEENSVAVTWVHFS